MTDEALGFLESICRIDSRTLDCPEGTVAVARALGQRLEPHGFAMQWFDPGQEEKARGRHLVAVRPASGSQPTDAAPPRLILIGHTDTVLSPELVPVEVDRAANRICGSGVADMKGGDLVMVDAAIAALARSEAVRGAELVVLLNCAEEISSPSFHRLARQWAAGARACLTFEPARPGPGGRHDIVVARKGVRRFALTCHGRAAHAGGAHEHGVSAIAEIARIICELEALTDYGRHIVLNVGTLRGGSATNQVPDFAEASFQVRAYDPDLLEATCERIRAICSRSTVSSVQDGATTHTELSGDVSYPPWPASAQGAALARRYIELARARGVEVAPVHSGGGSDASHVADLIPTLDGLGIRGGGLHTVHEWADIPSLASATQIAADMIVDLCEHGVPK